MAGVPFVSISRLLKGAFTSREVRDALFTLYNKSSSRASIQPLSNPRLTGNRHGEEENHEIAAIYQQANPN
jgi:hypothetical protein